MAKNIIQKKKRVARIKSVFDGEIEGECLDYVSSIIKNMDSNFKAVQPNKKRADLSQSKVTCLTEHEKDSPNSSTSKDKTQNINFLPRSKKFGLSRKFPLMEKSRKILQHLKHNQSIPKQRSHLASLLMSPIKKNVKKNSGASIQKKSTKPSIIKDKQTKNNSYNERSNNRGTFSKKDSKFGSSKKQKVSCIEVNKSNVESNYNCKNSCSENYSVDNRNIVNDSKGDTTDSEYERFVQSNKKNLRKKFGKQKSSTVNTVAKRKPSKKIKKNIVRKRVSKLSDSDSSDEASSPHSTYGKRKKLEVSSKNKTRGNILLSDSETGIMNDEIYTRDTSSESDVMDGEIYTRGTSSESDIADTESTVKNTIDSQFVEQKSSDYFSLSEPHSSCIENVADTHTEYVSHDGSKNHLAVSMKCFDEIDLSSDSSSTTDKVADDNKCESVVSCNVPVLPLLKEDSSNVMTNITQDTAQLDHEESESDLEIVEIVLPVSRKSEAGSDNRHEFSKDVITNDSRSEEFKTHEAKSQCSVETKKLDSQIQVKVKNERQKRKDETDDKYEAVYSTDVCKEYQEIDSKVKILNSVSNISVSHNESEVKKEEDDDDDIILDCIIPANNLNKKCPSGALNISFVPMEKTQVKTETPDILIDYVVVKNVKKPVASSSIMNSNIKKENCSKDPTSVIKDDPFSFNNLKNEDISLKELKLYEVACSNLAQAEKLSGGMCDKLIISEETQNQNEENMSIEHLLENFKKEFQVYQNIIQAEASVEASLKAFESRQAEKLKNIRSYIQKRIENKNCVDKDSNPKINEQVNLLCKTQGISNFETSENKLQISPKCLSKAIPDFKNSKNAPSMVDISLPPQSILLPSTVQDVKPDLSAMQILPNYVLVEHSIVKSEWEPISVQKSSAENNTKKLLGEKCDACGKVAVAACQRCAKVFFCSNECGKKFWNDGHGDECGK